MQKTKTEAEECLRTIASSLNGIAGIDILRSDLRSAAENYREVLRLAATHEEKAHMDSFQRLHAITNLRHVVFVAGPASQNPDSVGRATGDDSLEQRAVDIRNYLTGKTLAVLSKAEAAVKTCEKAVDDTVDELRGLEELEDPDFWFVYVVDECVDAGSEARLVSALNEELGTGGLVGWIPAQRKMSTRFLPLKTRLCTYFSLNRSVRQ
jgi:hypothetical protein